MATREEDGCTDPAWGSRLSCLGLVDGDDSRGDSWWSDLLAGPRQRRWPWEWPQLERDGERARGVLKLELPWEI